MNVTQMLLGVSSAQLEESALLVQRSVMSKDQQGNPEFARLPKELLDRLTEPLAPLLAIEATAGANCLLFTIAALVLSNSPWAHSFLNA